MANQQTQTASKTTSNTAEIKSPSEAAAEQPLMLNTSAAVAQALKVRSVDEAVWRSLCNSCYPGAKPESVMMVIDYCRARKLDPLLKPVHIVPMDVKDAKTQQVSKRDVVMPGIYLYRIIAHRTGLYLGHSEPVFEGEEIYNKGADGKGGVHTPRSCSMVFYRWNATAGREVKFPVKVFFDEVAMFKDAGVLNAKWSESPVQMLTKCTEAAGLRETFPEELGGTHTDDEMMGRVLDAGLGAEPGTTQRGKPHAEDPKARVIEGATTTIWTKVPVVDLAELIDKVGIPVNQFLAQFELGGLDELPLNKVNEAFIYLHGLLPQ